MQTSGLSESGAHNAQYDLTTATDAKNAVANALQKALAWQKAENTPTATQTVSSYAQDALQNATNADTYLSEAKNATSTSSLISALTSMQNLVDSAVSNANDAISSMTDAGYIKPNIASATYDLETGNAAAKALQNALNDANSWAATNASYAKEKATVADLSESISQMTKQLSNLESIAEELEVDSKILAEPFAWMPSTSKASYSSAVPSWAERSSQPSSKNLAITGDDAVDVILAAGGLAGLGLVTEAIKKNRERRSGKN